MLKKNNNIDTDYYYNKMDRGDVSNALEMSGITQEVFDWIFEPDIKKRASVVIEKG